MQGPLCCRLDGHKLQHPWVHLPAVAMLMTTFKRDSTTCENNSIVCMGFVGGAVHSVVFLTNGRGLVPLDWSGSLYRPLFAPSGCCSCNILYYHADHWSLEVLTQRCLSLKIDA